MCRFTFFFFLTLSFLRLTDFIFYNCFIGISVIWMGNVDVNLFVGFSKFVFVYFFFFDVNFYFDDNHFNGILI